MSFINGIDSAVWLTRRDWRGVYAAGLIEGMKAVAYDFLESRAGEHARVK